MTALLRILGLWRGRWGWLLFGAGIALASGLTGVALLALAGAHVAVMLLAAAVSATGLLAALGPARVGLRYAERLATHAATFRALADLRVWLFTRLAARSAGGLGMQRAGDLAARLVADVETLDGLYLRILVPLLVALVLLPLLLLILVGEGGSLGLAGFVAVGLFAVAAFAIPWRAATMAGNAGSLLAEAGSALRVAVLDGLTGLREVRIFAAEPRVLDIVATRDQAIAAAAARLARDGVMAQAAGFICAQAAILLILLQAAHRPVFATAAVFLLVAAFEAAAGLPRAGALAGHAAAAARRVLDAAGPPSSKSGPTQSDPGQSGSADAVPLPAGTALRFEAVQFRWAPDRPPVFDGLTLELAQGARVAILGPSGCGKSTLAALLLRVASPQGGRVLLGGTDIATVPADAVRSRFAVLSQATHLFDDTIRANLLLGQPAADEPALWRALDQAEVGEFVRSLPDRLDTWLGEGGARVSGGQGRRIALARTLLSPAPILVLDEPTAGLDAQTERAFLQTLNTLPPGRTLLLITHRLTGVEMLDRIWRLSGGHAIVATG